MINTLEEMNKNKLTNNPTKPQCMVIGTLGRYGTKA